MLSQAVEDEENSNFLAFFILFKKIDEGSLNIALSLHKLCE
jgi:hypothetical protein